MCRFVWGNEDSTKMTGSRIALSKRGLSIEQANAKSQLVTSICDRVRGAVWDVLVCYMLGLLCVWYFRVSQHVPTVSACSDYCGTVSVSDETRHSQEKGTHYITAEMRKMKKTRVTHIVEALLHGGNKEPTKMTHTEMALIKRDLSSSIYRATHSLLPIFSSLLLLPAHNWISFPSF